MIETGMVEVYTGEGKGKTTASIGLGIRAAGRGNRVFMIQFLKSSDSGELETVKKLQPAFQIFRFGKTHGFFWNMNEEQKAALKAETKEAFEFARMAALEDKCDVLILDEIMGVLKNKLLHLDEIIDFIKIKPQKLELILTGRNAPDEIIELADYVSEIKAVKHPMDEGIGARKGIEF